MKINKLRNLMKAQGIDAYIVPSDDFHQSEYVGDYFKAREYITGFTGSAGTALIGMDEAYLWTDGRYYIQAARELSDTEFSLMKDGSAGVLSIVEYVKNNYSGKNIGFDGRVVSYAAGCEYENIGNVIYNVDLIDSVWEDRPPMACTEAYFLNEKYTGESVENKLSRCRQYMKEKGANIQILSSLDDICWMLNMRADDVHYSNLLLCYAIIYENYMVLYSEEKHFSLSMKAEFENKNIELKPYNDIYEDVKNLPAGMKVMVDYNKINYALFKNITHKVSIVEAIAPQSIFKCIKNETEAANIRKAQLKDAIVHVRFMKWLKDNFHKGTITELVAQDKMEELRKAQPGYIAPSFAPICAYGEHAASPHYSSCKETDVVLKEGNVFLTDTGGGYYQGSTDITRTYAIGNIPQIIKDHFTLTAIANLRLADAVFLEGCCGQNLDYIAREPFWRRKLNYNHGTGHGVGYLLNVHEGTAAFRYRITNKNNTPLKEGMIITDEPGIYIEGSHGIRLENNLLVRKDSDNEYGQFMHFETLTYIPFDKDAINVNIMDEHDRYLLNRYHKKVYEKLSPYLTAEETSWLRHYTEPV